MNVPFDVVVQKIQDEAGISKEEIDKKISVKLDQLSGLISKEGAAHIVANELGIDLLKTDGILKITHLTPGMRNVDIVGKVVRKYEVREFSSGDRKGKIGKFLLGDETGITAIAMWNDKADFFDTFEEGDVLKVENCTVRSGLNGRSELHMTDGSNILVNPKGITVETRAIGEVSETTKKKISELKENDINVEVFATIIQIYDIRFFEVCPECNKRAKPTEDGSGFSCATHGVVAPSFASVLNILVDDGTEKVRVVLWRNQIAELLNLKDDELVKYKDDPVEFEGVKADLLGHQIKIVGKVSNNNMFNRLEMNANRVIFNIDPEKEISSLKSNSSNNSASQDSSALSKVSDSAKKDIEKKKSKPVEESLDEDEDDLLSYDSLEDLEEDF